MNRPVILSLAGLAVVVAALALSVVTTRRDEGTPVPAVATAPAKPKPGAPEVPVFDMLRVSNGDAVLAGRAMPKADVVIFDQGKEIGRTIADNRGEWVFVPDGQLAPGPHLLTLHAFNPDGTEGEAPNPLPLSVPAPKPAGQ